MAFVAMSYHWKGILRRQGFEMMTLRYIFHSGFLLETARCILVFDYWMDPADVMSGFESAWRMEPFCKEKDFPFGASGTKETALQYINNTLNHQNNGRKRKSTKNNERVRSAS